MFIRKVAAMWFGLMLVFLWGIGAAAALAATVPPQWGSQPWNSSLIIRYSPLTWTVSSPQELLELLQTDEYQHHQWSLLTSEYFITGLLAQGA